MNNRKLINLLLFIFVFLFTVGSNSYAFTVERPDPDEYKPLTPAERRAYERKARGQQDTPPPYIAPEITPSGDNSHSSGNAGHSTSVTPEAIESAPTEPAPTPTPEPTPTPQKEGSATIVVFSIVFLGFAAIIALIVLGSRKAKEE